MTDEEFKALWEKLELERAEEIKQMIRREQASVIRETENQHDK